MKNGGMLSISELARFARISRTALIHYDHFGLVSPRARGDNNYRYYSHDQITATNVINTLQSLGMSLKEIKVLMNARTPESTVELFFKQGEMLGREIERLRQSRKLLLTLHDMIEKGLSADENVIEARVEDEESIFLGPQIDYSGGKTIEEATLEFYEYCMEREPEMDLNYPVWGLFNEERTKNHDWNGPDRFYFWMPDAPDRKPKGLYVTGYTRGYYGTGDKLYRRIMKFIDDNGFEICGPSWEMYLLNEISVADENSYLMKISIPIKS
jgi:DNA-binding transcriptional MerR regulator